MFAPALAGCFDAVPLEGKKCSTSHTCGRGLVCLGARCGPIIVDPPPKSCETEEDCTGKKRSHCKEEDQLCVQCLEDGHCPGTEVCLVAVGRCFPCKKDGHCSTNLCVDFQCAACGSDVDLYCKPGFECTDGVCMAKKANEPGRGA